MRIFLLAGEPSGDRLGAALIATLKQLRPNIQFEGVGGPAMASEGLMSQFPMEELSLMGITEVLPKYCHLRRRIQETASAIISMGADLLVTIDSPDFSLRVAKLLKSQSTIPTVHYVAPTVWAWRPKRAEKMAKVIDHVLALFPFEPPFIEAAGISCDYVGHPIISDPVPNADDAAKFRASNNLGDAPVILILPGSRIKEVSRLLKPFGDALQFFLQDHPEFRVVIPTVSAVEDLVRNVCTHWPGSPIILSADDEPSRTASNGKRGAFAAANIALAASGTVSLELAASRTPMVIGYKFSWITWQIVKRMAKIDTATLVNILSDSRAVPECFGHECRGDKIYRQLNEVWLNSGTQIDAMDFAMARLKDGCEVPSMCAAQVVLNYIERSDCR